MAQFIYITLFPYRDGFIIIGIIAIERHATCLDLDWLERESKISHTKESSKSLLKRLGQSGLRRRAVGEIDEHFGDSVSDHSFRLQAESGRVLPDKGISDEKLTRLYVQL
jgi:hypothetical protein